MNSTPETSAPDGWRVAALLARVLVGGLFVATAIAKLADPLKFAEEIQNYQLVPIAVTHLLALVLPWLEGLAGLLLALGVWRAEARSLIAVMLVVFTLAKAHLWFVLGFRGSCGCAGGIVMLNTLLENPQGMITNLVLLALLIVDWRAQRVALRASNVIESAVEEAAARGGANA